jgi:Signal peptidase (SPase) II
MGRRLAVIVVGAVGLAAVDLAVKTGLPTSPWLLHERSIGWVVLSAALVAGCLALARVPSRFVAVAAGLSAAGALGNLISAMGHEGAVPDPLLLGGAANGVAFNLADVFVVLGLLGLVPALVATSVQNRRSLIPPRSWERRLRRKIGGSGADRGAIRADASTAAKPGVRTMLIICAAAALLAGAFLFAANIHTGESLLS